MKSRFQLDPESGQYGSATAFPKYDGAGAEFAASSEQPPLTCRFLVDDESITPSRSDGPTVSSVPVAEGENCAEPICEVQAGRSEHGDWRDEITARITRYRERRGA